MDLARRRLKHLALMVVCIVSLGFVPGSAAQSPKATEYELKAAYLYNFGKFVNWPAAGAKQSGEEFVVCVLGQDPFGPVLDSTVAGEKVGGKAVTVKRINQRDGAAACRIIFISASEQPRLRQILMDAPAGTLTVSDIPDFLARGGMIQFVTRENKVRFEVNLTAAERAGLSLSSELLKVAVAVRKNQEREN